MLTSWYCINRDADISQIGRRFSVKTFAHQCCHIVYVMRLATGRQCAKGFNATKNNLYFWKVCSQTYAASGVTGSRLLKAFRQMNRWAMWNSVNERLWSRALPATVDAKLRTTAEVVPRPTSALWSRQMLTARTLPAFIVVDAPPAAEAASDAVTPRRTTLTSGADGDIVNRALTS